MNATAVAPDLSDAPEEPPVGRGARPGTVQSIERPYRPSTTCCAHTRGPRLLRQDASRQYVLAPRLIRL